MRLGVAHQPCRLFGLALDKSCSLLLLSILDTKNNKHSPRFVANLMISSSSTCVLPQRKVWMFFCLL